MLYTLRLRHGHRNAYTIDEFPDCRAGWASYFTGSSAYDTRLEKAVDSVITMGRKG